MTIIQRIWLLISLMIIFAFLTALIITVNISISSLQVQLEQKNNDAAQLIALSLSQHGSDEARMKLVVASQFDLGSYLSLRLIDPLGREIYAVENSSQSGLIPQWFVESFPISQAKGVGHVSNQWKPIGSIEVLSQLDFAYEQLWKNSAWSFLLMVGFSAFAGIVSVLAMASIKRPLNAVIEQATAISERRFVQIPEPRLPEMRAVTGAMNQMVRRLQAVFIEYADQLEKLRHTVDTDDETGLFNRAAFIRLLQGRLVSEKGTQSGFILLIRLFDLQSINRQQGRAALLRLLKNCSEGVQVVVQNSSSAVVGKLNETDLAILLGSDADPLEISTEIVEKLSQITRSYGLKLDPTIGGFAWSKGTMTTTVLSAADQALAAAEFRGHGSIEISGLRQSVIHSEEHWRKQMNDVVEHRRIRLTNFPVVNPNGEIIQYECPLRISLHSEDDWMTAANWLPMARRTGRLVALDILAIESALIEIRNDHVPRSINVSDDSLEDLNFLDELTGLLSRYLTEAPLLWLELTENGAFRHKARVTALCSVARVNGASVGLEHAGQRLSQSAILLDLGLHFIKLDSSFTQGIASSGIHFDRVRGTVALLKSVGLLVIAEGVNDMDTLQALWRCGCDGATGPAVRVHGG